MLLQFRCPLEGAPRRSWYVAGAAARVGADGISSGWSAFWDESPPSIRTIRDHLRRLQDAGTIVAAPGAWLPILRQPEHPERRPRYPDTFHILETDEEASWWAEVGVLEATEEAGTRHNPDKWAAQFANWRSRARRHAKRPELLFDAGQVAAADKQRGELTAEPARENSVDEHQAEDAAVLEVAVLHASRPVELLEAMAEVGAPIRGGLGFRMIASGERLRGAVALLSQAMRREKRIHNRAGWLVGVWKDARANELAAAIALSRSSAIRAELTA